MPIDVPPSGTHGAAPPPGPKPLMKMVMSLASAFMRLKGLTVIQLTTVGARTGAERTNDLVAVPEGTTTWIVAASAGGAAKHPAWFFNMARNPDKIWLSAGNGKVKVQADTLKGEEREAAWNKLVAVYAGYNGYRKKTDREIPVLRLSA